MMIEMVYNYSCCGDYKGIRHTTEYGFNFRREVEA